MGFYSEHLDRQMSFDDLGLERKRILKTISELRGGRAGRVLAADLNNQRGGGRDSAAEPSLLPYPPGCMSLRSVFVAATAENAHEYEYATPPAGH